MDPGRLVMLSAGQRRQDAPFVVIYKHEVICRGSLQSSIAFIIGSSCNEFASSNEPSGVAIVFLMSTFASMNPPNLK